MKTCSDCKRELDESCFNRKGLGLQYSCKECRKIYHRKHYLANKDKYIANAKLFIARTQSWIDSLKDKPCMDCGGSFPSYVMDFDHRPGDLKLFELSKAAVRGFSRKAILLEIAKCDLVCSNCHRVRTWSRRSS